MSTWASGKLTQLFQKFKGTEYYTAKKAALGNLAKGAVATFRLSEASIATSAIAGLMGGIATKSVALIGHFTQITLFTALDTIVHSWVEDVVLNINYGNNSIIPNPNSFPRKSEIIYDLLEKESKEKFANDTPACEKDIQDSECRTKDIEGALYNFGEAINKWKEFNQTKAIAAHSQWLEMINKYQNMEQLTKKYYTEFLLDVKKANLCIKDMEKCKTFYIPHDADPKTLDLEARQEQKLSIEMMPEMVNQRLYPLYGVDPIPNASMSADWKSMYLVKASELQGQQQLRVHFVGAQLEEFIKTRKELNGYKVEFDKIVEALKSSDLNQNAYGLNMLRSIANATGGVNEGIQSIAFEYLRKMGSPAPVMNYGQGFTYAFELNSSFKDLVRQIELPEFYRNLSLSTRYKFAKKTDYLTYNMLCGPAVDNGGNTTDGTLRNLSEYFGGMRTLFIPPRLVTKNTDMDICGGLLGFKSSAFLYSEKLQDKSDKKTYSGIFHAIYNNFAPEIKNVINADKYGPTEEEKKDEKSLLVQPLFAFDQWWEKYVETQVATQMEVFKRDYEAIAVKYVEAQFKDNGSLFGVVDTNTGVLQNSVVMTGMQASRAFSMVLAEVIKSNLGPAEYKDLLADSSQIQNVKPSKIKYKQDILKLQTSPWLQDLEAIKYGTAPKIFVFQQQNEKVLMELYKMIRNTKVVNELDIDGKERAIVKIDFPMSDEIKNDKKSTPAYKEWKAADDFEKKISEMNKEMEKSVDAILEKLTKKVGQGNSKEVPKALRIVTFAKDKMLQLSQDMMATISTIKFAAFQAALYSAKNKSKEDLERQAARAEREQKQEKCSSSRRMGTMTKGDGC